MLKRFLCLALALAFCGCTSHRSNVPLVTAPITEPLEDTMDGYNRGMHSFDTGVKKHVLSPMASAWRFVFPKVAREKIGNFCDNTMYPLRALTHVLGGDFADCWEDTKRFGVNTTYGILGFNDPASDMGLPVIPGGFAKTFANWGIGNGPYLELPLAGGDSTRNQAGMVFDFVCNPLTYFAPAEATLALGVARSGNLLGDTMPTLDGIYNAYPTHYEMLKFLVYYRNEVKYSKYQYEPNNDKWNADDSFAYLGLMPQSLDTMYNAKTRTVSVEDLGKVKFSCFPCKGARKLVVILPGISNHRLDGSVVALAEKLNARGVSVLSLSSPFQQDYMKDQDKPRPAGYVLEDARDMAAFVAASIDAYRKEFADGAELDCSMLGYSYGALLTLHIASQENACRGLIGKYVAINPPLDLAYSQRKLDEYCTLPAAWGRNEAEREARVRDVFMRFAAFLEPNNLNPRSKRIPLTRDESHYVLALNIRLHLAAYILDRTERAQLGVLEEMNGNAKFAAALQCSFGDYLDKVLMPWYKDNGYGNLSKAEMQKACTLAAIDANLPKDGRVLILHSKNDPIVAPNAVFGPDVLLFDRGGHLGNMADPDFQDKVLSAL